MSRVIENEYDDKGNCIFHREGYLGDATCPTCGYPLPAVFWNDGGIEVDLCDYCKREEKKKTYRRG